MDKDPIIIINKEAPELLELYEKIKKKPKGNNPEARQKFIQELSQKFMDNLWSFFDSYMEDKFDLSYNREELFLTLINQDEYFIEKYKGELKHFKEYNEYKAIPGEEYTVFNSWDEREKILKVINFPTLIDNRNALKKRTSRNRGDQKLKSIIELYSSTEKFFERIVRIRCLSFEHRSELRKHYERYFFDQFSWLISAVIATDEEKEIIEREISEDEYSHIRSEENYYPEKPEKLTKSFWQAFLQSAKFLTSKTTQAKKNGR